MSAATSEPTSPGTAGSSPMSSTTEAAEPSSSAAVVTAGAMESTAFHKERRSSVSLKRHHDDDVDYEKEDNNNDNNGSGSGSGGKGGADEDEDSNGALRHTRTNSTASAASDGADTAMSESPATKKKRISIQLPEHIRAQKQRDAAAAAAAANGDGAGSPVLPRKPERSSSLTHASPPSTPHTPGHSPIARRLSMTEDQKRANYTLSIARALRASYPLSPVTDSSPGAVSPHIQSIAATLEQSLFARHGGLSLEYTAHVRDVAFNLTHSTALARRIVDGRISIERVSGMSWKEFADGEVQREREERKEEDLVAHLAPVDVAPGILPSAKTAEKR